MEPLVSVIKNLLLTWYQISINNPEYLAAVVFLSSIILGIIMAASHRGKIATLKSNFEAERLAFEQNRVKASHYLDHVEQQLQQTKEELQQANGQLQSKDQHIEQISKDYQAAQAVAARVVNLELQVDQRNKDMAQLVQSLEAGLGAEQSTTATDGLDSTVLWQRHEGAVKQIIDRLQTTQTLATALQHNQQTLTDQLSTKQAIIQELHETLELQNTRMTQLEADLDTQKQLTEQEIQKTVDAIENSAKAKLEAATLATTTVTAKIPTPEPLLEAPEIETEPQALAVDSLPQDSDSMDSVVNEINEVVEITETISQQPSITAVIESVPEIQVAVAPEQSEPTQPSVVLSDAIAEPITVADATAEIIHKQPLYEETSWFKPFKKKTPDLSSDSVAESLADGVVVVPATDTAKAAVHQPPLQEKKSWFKPFKKKNKDSTEKDKLAANQSVKAKATPAITTVDVLAHPITESPATIEPITDEPVETVSKQPLYEDPSWFKVFKKKTKETKSNDTAVANQPAPNKIAVSVEAAPKQVNNETITDSIIEPVSEAVATVESTIAEVVKTAEKTLSPKKKSWLNSFVEKFNQMSDHDTYH